MTTIIINQEKNNQAVEIIAAEIAKLPADTIMDYGTLGHSRGLTKRQGEANSMARYFVRGFYGKGHENETEIVEMIAAVAVEKSGK